MPKIIDETNKRYGALTVIKKDTNIYPDKRVRWICKCDCGNTKIVMGKLLRNGSVKSCGCKSHIYNKEIGKKYGKLKVISFHSLNERNEIVWNCECDCGNIAQVKTSSLHSGHTKSCGCLSSPNLVGKVFGNLTVIEETELRQRGIKLWKCKCKCGNFTTVTTNNLTSGNTSSCGCITSSIGEKNIENWLKQNNLKYKKEYVIPKLNYRFDFAVYDKTNKLILFIEFDGE